MVTAEQYVTQAGSNQYDGIPYKELDCQAFVEKVLADCGLKYDWRGSNDMWRNGVSERHPIEDPATVPAGAWLFTVKDDGGERERGYNDTMGNAAHVGIYLGEGTVRHSTKTSKADGVQYDKISSKRWTHWALCKYVNYSADTGVRELVRKLGQYSLADVWKAMRAEWG